jgi:ketosteroid isomerase-like protein
MHSIISELEEQLRLAMCNSDIFALDKLLAENLMFTNHLGQRVSKAEDIDAHRKKLLVITDIALSNQEVINLGNSIVVATQADISGSYNGNITKAKFRFTRVWAKNADTWQVVAGHSSVIS